MPKKSRRGRALLFPSRPHFDGVALAVIEVIGSRFVPPVYSLLMGERRRPKKEAVRVRRKRQREARRRARSE